MLVPAIGDPSDRDGLLLPVLSRRRVKQLASESGGDLWQFTGGQYDESASFWVDSSGLLARYQWRQEFAPYFGVAWESALGDTRGLLSDVKEDRSTWSFVLGLRTWF